MKRIASIITLISFTCVSADTAPPSIVSVEAAKQAPKIDLPSEPTSLPQPKEEKKNYTSLYVFLGTVVAATAGILRSSTHNGRHTTQAQKDSKTGDVTQ